MKHARGERSAGVGSWAQEDGCVWVMELYVWVFFLNEF